MKVSINYDTVNLDNIEDVMSELSNVYDELRMYRNSFCKCTRCEELYPSDAKGSQWTEDGRLCPDCHEIYTITYDPEEWGAVGVTSTKTGEWIDYKTLDFRL